MRFLFVNRIRIVVCLFVLCSGGAAFSQVDVHGVELQHLSGDLNAGYDGQITNDDGSTHDLGLGGDLSTTGYYYNPNFLSFNASSYYDRAQSNADTTSLNTSKGYLINSRIFGGSTTPGSIAFDQAWGKTSSYGVPGLTGLASLSNMTDFNVSWMFKRFSVLKNLSLTFSDDKTNTTIPGLGVSNDVKTQAFGIGTSGYNFWGFPLAVSYEHLNVNSAGDLNANVGDDISSTTSENIYHVSTGHQLPYASRINLSAYRMSSVSDEGGSSSNNVSDELDSSFTSHVWHLPLSGNVTYNDNVYGEELQEMNASGQTVPISTTSPRIGTLQANLSTSYGLPHNIFVTAFITQEEEYSGGSSVGATAYGANAAYGFGKFLKGLTVIFGLHDTATQDGNEGAGLIGTVTYTRNWRGWRAFANFSYDQNIQTLLAAYTTSSVASSGTLRRDLGRGFLFGLNASYGRSVFSNVAGMNSYSEGAGANFAWHRQSINFSYAQSGGTSIITGQGLVTVTTPGLVTNSQIPYSGHSYTAGFGSQIVKHMSASVGWTRFSNSSTSSSDTIFNSSSEQYTGTLMFNYRKLLFMANAISSDQGTNSSSTLPSKTTVYYFGVSRWFNFF